MAPALWLPLLCICICLRSGDTPLVAILPAGETKEIELRPSAQQLGDKGPELCCTHGLDVPVVSSGDSVRSPRRQRTLSSVTCICCKATLWRQRCATRCRKRSSEQRLLKLSPRFLGSCWAMNGWRHAAFAVSRWPSATISARTNCCACLLACKKRSDAKHALSGVNALTFFKMRRSETPLKGGRPHSITYATTPALHTSQAWP